MPKIESNVWAFETRDKSWKKKIKVLERKERFKRKQEKKERFKRERKYLGERNERFKKDRKGLT